MKQKFLEFTDEEDKKILLNTEQILWMEEDTKQPGFTKIYLNHPGKGSTLPKHLSVKEKFDNLKQMFTAEDKSSNQNDNK